MTIREEKSIHLARSRHHRETDAIRVGQYQPSNDQHSEPMTLTASYVFDDAQDADDRFSSRKKGNVYIRFDNPTVQAFEQRIAALEGGETAIGLGSGMAAYLSLVMAYLKPGDHVLLARGMFGTTPYIFGKYFNKFGVTSEVIDVTDLAAWDAALTASTRMIVIETPTNPRMQVADIAHLAALAHRNNALLVVDNTICTPIFQTPLQLGADLVVHSAGKYIDGQGRCGGGVVVGPEHLIAELRGVLRGLGPSLSPFNAWVFLKSLETLSLRMAAHQENAMRVAEWLSDHPFVEDVLFTGLLQHPQYKLIKSQQSGHSGLLSFTVRGDKSTAWRVVDTLRLVSRTTNIGDTKSIITHPATTTHCLIQDHERLEAGITDNLLRLSVGLEHIDDIIGDLNQAFIASETAPVAAARA